MANFEYCTYTNKPEPHHTHILIEAGSKHFVTPSGEYYHWGDFTLLLPINTNLETYDFTCIPENDICDIGIETCAEGWGYTPSTHLILNGEIGIDKITYLGEDYKP